MAEPAPPAHTAAIALESVPSLVLCLETSGRVSFCNSACERTTGKRRDDLVGTAVTDTLMDPPEWERIRSLIGAADAGQDTATCEATIKSETNGPRLIQWHVSRFPGSGGEADMVVCAGSDITDKRRLENQLLQTEKLSALGQLVAGVAHELNNPLTGVLGYAQIVSRLPECPDSIREDVQRITDNARRCKSVVEGLLRFARQNKPERRPMSVREALDATIELMSYHFRNACVEVRREYGTGTAAVMGDVNELQQVFVNLFTNAIYEMKNAHGRGTLFVRTASEGENVRVEIVDDGPGMPPDVIERVFDPFYTTKPVGEGTGLGLSVCYGIVTAHKGRIFVASSPGSGTAFTILLPACGGGQPAARPRTTDTQMLRLKQRVLIVDDEETVRDVLSRILSSLGFRIETAESAEAATRIIEGGRVDIVVCDFRMPGMGGQGLYEWMLRNRPELTERIVFCTGDTVSKEAKEFLRETNARVVTKPFNMSQLARTLAEVQYDILQNGDCACAEGRMQPPAR